MGHNFGMSHDFDDKHCNNTKKVCVSSYGERCECQGECEECGCQKTTECVAGNGPDNCICNGKGIMSYNSDKPMRWSSCSVKDFIGYYNSEKWGSMCLKGNIIYLLNYISIYLTSNIVVKYLSI